MKYMPAKQGRIFVLRFEHGDTVHEEIERFAREQSIAAGVLILVGGADQGSKLVVGPQDGEKRPILPLEHILTHVHEVAGIGTLFSDDNRTPLLHMHMACGRNAHTVTGCIRTGVQVWQIMEGILIELLDTGGARIPDAQTGFKLLKL